MRRISDKVFITHAPKRNTAAIALNMHKKKKKTLTVNGPPHAKTCFGHMWTAKAQISLRIHAVSSGPSELLDTTKCMNGEQKPR